MKSEDVFLSAVRWFECGQFAQSEAALLQVLRTESEHVQALMYTGRIAAKRGDTEQACVWFSRACALPCVPAQAYFELGYFQEILADSQGVSNGTPTEVTSEFASEGVHEQEKEQSIQRVRQGLQNALNSYDQACERDPNLHQAFFNKANIHKRLAQPALALQAYNQAIFIRPDEPYYRNNRGDLLLTLRSFPYALEDFEVAVSLLPNVAYFYDNWASTLKEMKRYDAAAVRFKRALYLNPESALTYNNIGSLFLEREVWDHAIASFEMALRLNPVLYQAHYNKGLLYQRLEQMQAALSSYAQALKINPTAFEPLWNITIAELTRGNLKQGLIGYEQRWRLPENAGQYIKTTKPVCTTGVQFDRIFIWNEHGVGNEIFFASFLRHEKFSNKKIIAKFDARLHALLKHSFSGLLNIRLVSTWEEVSEDQYDVHLPIASVLNYLNIDPDQSVQWRTPYLRPELAGDSSKPGASLRDTIINTGLSAEQPTHKPLVVGLSWRSVNQKTGARRSIRLGVLINALKHLPIHWVSLQYGDVAAEIAAVQGTRADHVSQAKGEAEVEQSQEITQVEENLSSTPNTCSVQITQIPEIDNFSDLSGLARLIKACDLVVSVDNSTLHLASALGVPCCALISRVADWRWFLNRSDTPWYQHTKLYRQERSSRWEGALEKLSFDLQRVLATR